MNLLKRKGGVYASRPLEWIHFSENRDCTAMHPLWKMRRLPLAANSYEDQLKQKEAWIYRYLAALSECFGCLASHHPLPPPLALPQ